MLAFLLLAGLVNYLDRSSLSIANNSIRSELHLSGTEIGLLLSAFSLAYGFAQLPIGPLLDRFGARRVLGAGLGFWSLAQIMTGFVSGMRFFLLLRVLLGLGEAPYFPASIKAIRDRFDDRERGRATAMVNMSSILGQALAPPLLTVLMMRFGWRDMFIMIGSVGLLLAAVWFPLQREQRPEKEALSGERRAGGQTALQQWAMLFKQRTIWGLMLGFGGINFTAWFYIAWLPAYLRDARGVSIGASGWLTAIPFLAGSVGMYFSGVAADWQARAGVALPKIHRRQIVLGMVLSALFTSFAAQVGSVGTAVACISGALFFIHFAGTSCWGYVQAASPSALVATVSSIQNFGSFLIASVAPLLTGWLLDRTHSFVAAFAFCAAVTLTGALIYLTVVRGIRQPEPA